MADDKQSQDQPLYPTEEVGEAKKGKINGKFLLLAGVGVLVMLFQMGVIGPDSDPSPPAPSSQPGGTPQSGVAASAQQGAQAGIQDGVPMAADLAFDTVAPSDQSAVVLLQTNQNQMARRINDIITAQNAASQRQEEFERRMSNSMDRRMSEITEMIQTIAVERARDVRMSSTPAVRLDDDGLPILESKEPLSSLKPQDDPFGYRVYGPVQGNEGGTHSSRALDDLLGTPGAGTGQATAPENKPNILDDLKESVPEKKPTYKVSVPAGSFVRVRNLHGVDCPVGGGIADDLFSNVPAGMIVMGDFQGPNGATINLRQAQLLGSCVGQKNTLRGRFRITHFSYFDEDGEQHFEPIAGYINDAYDNSLDVSGYLISSRVSDVAKSAAATALSTGANFMSASQFTNTASAGSGTTTQSMTGQLGTAVAGASVANAFEQIADMYAREVSSSIEVIHIPAGVEMNFHLSRPFTLELPDYDVPELG